MLKEATGDIQFEVNGYQRSTPRMDRIMESVCIHTRDGAAQKVDVGVGGGCKFELWWLFLDSNLFGSLASNEKPILCRN